MPDDKFLDALTRVRRASRARRAADRAWRESIREAVDQGVMLTQVAKVAGISRQAAYGILEGAEDRAARPRR